MTITQEVDIEVDVDELLDEISTNELLGTVEARLESEKEQRNLISEYAEECMGDPHNMRFLIEKICARCGGSYIDKATAKRVVCEIIDDVFYEI